MERMDLAVPSPLLESVEQFEETEGYDNRSQAARELLRRGLDQ